MSQSDIRLIVSLGTLSPLKLSALEASFHTSHFHLLQLPSFRSAVKEQPVGAQETLLGADARAQAALEYALASPHSAGAAAVGLGIENGMLQDDAGAWSDAAAVVLLVARPGISDPLRLEGWSARLPLPAAAVLSLQQDPAAWQDGAPTGDVTWSPLKDPHAAIDPLRPRASFLRDTIVALVQQHRSELPEQLVNALKQ